jgi:hypothetical protein
MEKESYVSVMRSGIVYKRLPRKRAGSLLSCKFFITSILSHTRCSQRYDVSGVDPSRVADIIERDWIHLVHEKNILDSPNYLRQGGKAVIALWGMFFERRIFLSVDPAFIRSTRLWLQQQTSHTRNCQGCHFLSPEQYSRRRVHHGRCTLPMADI